MSLKLQNKNKKQKVARGVGVPKAIEVEFQRALIKYNNELKKAIRAEIYPLLRNSQLDYQADGIGMFLNEAIEKISERFNFNNIAYLIAEGTIAKLLKTNAKKIQNTLKTAVGVDVETILQNENLTDFVEAQTIKNAQLIKSVPTEAIEDIRQIVLNGLTNGTRVEEIEKQIGGLNKSSVFNKMGNRIKTIARTETAKINSQIAIKRYENLGIKKAIWDASGDSRVRPCHQARDGKVYDLSKGLYSSCDSKTLFPGQDYNCRCVSRPIIE